MENNIVLDFYGLPGSGKSTISHHLALILSKELTVDEPSYNMEHRHRRGIRFMLKSLATIYLLVTSLRRLLILRKLLLGAGLKMCQKSYFSQILNLSYKINYLTTENSKILIFDQGLCQATASIFWRRDYGTDALSVYSNLQRMVGCRKRIVNVYVVSDVETAMDRLTRRRKDNNNSRVQLLSKEEQQTELRQQASFFEKVPCDIRINSLNRSVEQCANDVAKNLYLILSNSVSS